MSISKASAPSEVDSGSLRGLMRRHPLFSFFFMAYAISWLLEIPYLLSSWGILAGNFNFAFVLKGFGPTIAALIMTGVIGGRAGLLRLRERVWQWRAGWQWYLFLLLGIPVLVMLGIIAQPGVLASFQGVTPALLVSYPIYYAAVLFGGGPLGEELGWRGFALFRMQPRYGPLWGTLFLGVLWAFWHLPDFLDSAAQGGGPGTGWSTFLTNFPVFFLMVMALAIVFTWIFNHTRGSIFTALLAHASVNTPQLTLVPLFAVVGFTIMDRGVLISFGALALLILILTRGRLGYKEVGSWQVSDTNP